MRLRRARPERSDDEEFEGCLRAAAGKLGILVTSYDGDTVTLQGRLGGVLAVDDLRARCDLLPRSAWPGVVGEALAGLAASRERAVDLTDLVAVRPHLRSRVCTTGSLLLDDVVSAPLAAGLVEALVAEIGGAVASVPRTAAETWGVPADELLREGRERVLAGSVPDRRELDLDGVPVVTLESTGPFTATHVHRLGAYVDVPAAGALVAMPTRHLVLAAPLRTREQAIDAAQLLLVNADRIWTAGPGALSPDLFWWRPSGLVHLPGTPTSLSPPLEFVQVLDAL